jgi:formylglycine-generating enzyme required for sulfatase activity
MARMGRFLFVVALALLAACSKPGPAVKPLELGKPWQNTLGMRFVPVLGTPVMFSVYETRVRDFEPFEAETKLDRIGADIAQTPEHPVANVTWDDATAFCAWLTHRERVQGVLSASQRYRLPTDEEWSIAAGITGETGSTPGEKSSAGELRYVWGASWPPPQGAGNFAGEESEVDRNESHTFIKDYRDPFPRLAPVGQFQPNAFGLHDLAGNLLEWCADWFDATHRGRVARGGSWLSGDPRILAANHRAEIPPRAGLDVVGFRCVLEVNQ